MRLLLIFLNIVPYLINESNVTTFFIQKTQMVLLNPEFWLVQISLVSHVFHTHQPKL
jgi:hypothetical protein